MVAHGDAYLVILIHDVHGEVFCESVAVDDLPVVGRVVAHVFRVAAIGRVVLHNRAVDIIDQVLDELGLEIVGIGALAGAHLHGDTSLGLHAEGLIDAYK